MVIFTQKQTKRAAAITSARDLGVDWDTNKTNALTEFVMAARRLVMRTCDLLF